MTTKTIPGKPLISMGVKREPMLQDRPTLNQSVVAVFAGNIAGSVRQL
jgi:hypothetical protein